MLLGRWGHYLQGDGEINTLFSGIKGAQTPLGGLNDKKVTRHLAPQDKSTVNICDSYFK